MTVDRRWRRRLCSMCQLWFLGDRRFCPDCTHALAEELARRAVDYERTGRAR